MTVNLLRKWETTQVFLYVYYCINGEVTIAVKIYCSSKIDHVVK